MRLNKQNKLNGKRWRVLIELSKPVTCDNWMLIQQAISEQMGGDKSAARLQQILFAPNNPEISDPSETRHYEYDVLQGDPLNPDNLPYEIENHTAWLKELEDILKLESIKALQLRPRPSKSDGFTFEDANRMLPSIPELLVQYGNKKHGRNKYLSVNSSSGIAGIIVYVDYWVSHHESDSDMGVQCSNGTTGDAFDLYCFYEHGNDKKSALAALAKHDPKNKQRQKEYMQSIEQDSIQRNPLIKQESIEGNPQIKQDSIIRLSDINDNTVIQHTETYAPINGNPVIKKNYDWNMFSLNNKSKSMRQQMLDDKFVLNGMALMGQHTVFYGGPNVGKTLTIFSQVIEAIRTDNFNPADLMYVNADDTYKGLVTKLELAEQYNFQMVAPGHNNFKAGYLVPMLHEFITYSTANGKIIILDTLKKFTDLMDKKAGSDFSNTSRAFTSNGGTIISLAHVNKNKNSDGQSIKAGTSDISDDADCVYIIDVISDGDEKVVEFRNDKDRGAVDKTVTFSYDQTEKNYIKLLDSVKRINSTDTNSLKQKSRLQELHNKNIQEIGLIKELIFNKPRSQKEIVKNLKEFHGLPETRMRKILTSFTGNNPDDGYLWSYKTKDHNEYEYRLLSKY